MDIFEVIEKRHSYRGSFSDKPVTREDLTKIVQAGLTAPSGCNGQTTDFIIVDEPELVAEINIMHPTNMAMQTAKAFICCIVAKKPEPIYQDKAFTIEDCAAAVQNMLLTTTALGYASVWIDGWLRYEGRAEKIGSILNVPDEKIIRVLLPVGGPAEKPKGPAKKAFEERAFFNKYDK